jgi:putative ABC transport system permease protein
MIGSTATFLLFLFALVVLATLVLAALNRLAFRIGMRNVRRARGRTILLILGLLIGTTIISGSLVINDTVAQVNVHFVEQTYGYTDEGIYNQTASGGFQYFPYSVYTNISNALGSDPRIAGLSPEILSVAQAIDLRNGVPETNLDLVGVNGNQSTSLGPFVTDGGQHLDGPAAGQVLLDDQAAQQLGAQAGDPVRVYGPDGIPLNVTVQAIVQDDTRGGVFFLFAGQSGNVFIDLASAQQLVNRPAQINFIAATNPGDLVAGASVTPSSSEALNASLIVAAAPASLTVHALLHPGINQAIQSGQNTATFFLVFGLFSIIAGAILVVSIFVMLSEERMGEMGTVRAIGLPRRQLVYAYLFEGFAYAIGSSLAGAFLGVVVGYLMAYAFSVFLASGAVTSASILGSFTVTPDSLVIAYTVGFLLTMITVAAATGRASRLNIVRAIRSIPEPPPALRTYSRLAYLGVVLSILGALLFAVTYRGTGDVVYPHIGLALLVFGLAMVAARFFRNRIVFSTAGAFLILWVAAEPVRNAILGNQHSGTIFIVFVLGIELVVSAVLLYVFNASVLVEGLTRLFSGSSRRVAIAQTGLAYPGRRPVRPALTLSIFTLVVFTVVVIAGFGASLETNIESTLSAQTGGYSFYGQTAAPLPNIAAAIHDNSTLAGDIGAAVPLIGGAAFLNWAGLPAEFQPFGYPIQSAPEGLPDAADFYTGNQFTFASTLNGSSSAVTWERLATDPSAVVVDGNFGGSGFGAIFPTIKVGTTLAVANPLTGAATNATVIGVLTGALLAGVWLNPTEAGTLGFHQMTGSLLTVAPGVSTVKAAQDLKTAFFSLGLTLLDFNQVLASTISSFQAILSLLEIFAALGLAVGIAAMGIVALRTVSERRREIGMTRATGFTQRDVFYSFLLEYSFISLLGIGMGTALAMLLDYEASLGTNSGLTFTIPWVTIGLIVVVAYALTVVAVSGPALRAARMPPSEAVRYTE